MFKYELLIDAINQNKITSLKLSSKPSSSQNDYYEVKNVEQFVNIINAVALNTSIKSLAIHSIRYWNDEALKSAAALINLAEKNRSLISLEFSYAAFKRTLSACEFPHLTKFLQGLQGNPALQQLTLDGDVFEESKENIETINLAKSSSSGFESKGKNNNNMKEIFSSCELLIKLVKNRKDFHLHLTTDTKELSLPYILERLRDEQLKLLTLGINDIHDGLADCLLPLAKYILIGQPANVIFSNYNNAHAQFDDSVLFSALASMHLQSLKFLDDTFVPVNSLVQFLKNTHSLRQFQMEKFDLNDDEFSEIIEALRSINSLEALKLQGEISTDDESEDYMKDLIDVALKLPNLRCLSLDVALNNDDTLKHFARLGSKASLREFEMNAIGSDVTETGIKCIRNVLANPNLKIFRICAEDYKLTDKDVVILMEAFKYNKGLQVLDLRDNAITDEGAKVISARLLAESACSLVSIRLENNNLSEEGFKLIMWTLNKLKEPKKESPMEIDNSAQNNNNNSDDSYRMELN